MMFLAVILLATPLIAAADTARNNSCAYWQPRGEHGAKGWRVPDAPVRISPWIDSTNLPEGENRKAPAYEMGITVKPTLIVDDGTFFLDRATQLKRIRDSLANDWDVTSAYQTDFNDTIVISYQNPDEFGIWGGTTSGWYQWIVYKRCWMGALRFCNGSKIEDDIRAAENVTVCGYEVDEWNHDIKGRSTYSADDANGPTFSMDPDNEYNTDEYLMEEPQEHYEDAVKHASWYRLAKSQGQGVDDEGEDDPDSEAAGRQVASLGLSLGLVSLWMLMM